MRIRLRKIIEVAKKCLGIWKKLVHIEGEELERTKRIFSLMTWNLHNGKDKLSTITDEPGSLNLRSVKYTDPDIDLRRKSVQHAERLLGARLALDEGKYTKFSTD